jgi:hypothetical protein
MTDCVTSSSLRLLTRSATTPPKSVKMRNGMDPAKPTTPSQKAEPVSESTSQPWATFCIQVPMLERKLPLQKSRKLGLRRARTICGSRLVLLAAVRKRLPRVAAAASSTARLIGSRFTRGPRSGEILPAL